MFIQLFLLIIILFALSRAVVRYRAHLLTTGEFLFWLLVWVVGGVVVAWPEASSWLADLVGVGRGVDVVIYTALVLLFYSIFRIVTRIDRIERDITLLVRRKALEEHDEPR